MVGAVLSGSGTKITAILSSDAFCKVVLGELVPNWTPALSWDHPERPEVQLVDARSRNDDFLRRAFWALMQTWRTLSLEQIRAGLAVHVDNKSATAKVGGFVGSANNRGLVRKEGDTVHFVRIPDGSFSDIRALSPAALARARDVARRVRETGSARPVDDRGGAGA